MPFDTPDGRPKPHPGIVAAAILYGLAFAGCLGLAAWMHWGQGQEFASVPVLAPLGGAFWFGVRIAMVLRPNAHNIGSQD